MNIPAGHSGTATVDPCWVTMPPYRYTACQLLELPYASRLNNDAWRTVIELGIVAKLPTGRGCRGGVQKQRIIHPVIGHRPPTRQAIPSKQTGVDSANLVQLIDPSLRVTAVQQLRSGC